NLFTFKKSIAPAILCLSLTACSDTETPQSDANVAELAKSNAGLIVNEKLTISKDAISQEDLPPEGTRSLFDHFAAQNDGVPYPFDELVDALTKMHPQGKEPVIVMIPDGRSLLKGQANAEKPRVLLATDFQAPNTPASMGVNMRGQMFLGFTENADEIEVLSYNEAAGRFEFQLVQEYSATGSRKLVYAKRQICLTCHQGGAPIFSQRPWSETNADSNTVQAMLKAREEAGLDPHSYLGFPTTAPLSASERYDELTDVGNFFAATQKLWLDGCGAGEQGAACRKTMFKLALQFKAEPGSFETESTQVQALKNMQLASLGDTLIHVAESDLANRNPLKEKEGLKGFFNRFTDANVKLGDGAKDNEDLEAFDELPKLPVALDPLTKRPPKRELSANDIDGVFGLASLMTESDIDLLMKRSGYQMNRLLAAVDQLPNELFAEKAFERVDLVQALMQSEHLPGKPVSLAYAFTDVSEMSEPLTSGEPPLELADNSDLHLYQQYCFSCHRGNPSKRLNFMSGPDEQTVLAKIKETTEIRDALDWERYAGTDKASILMPPTDSVQYEQLSQDLKKNPELLTQMRDQVPSLFGF
ncbi:MAG: hypothetical protein R3194_10425, partial [Limnobacter sp.]|nr:hypothetical protein [Limnobacter sp.]